jgi:hypothetical protein
MRIIRTLAFLVFGFCIVIVALKGRAVHARGGDTSDIRSGDWTIRHSDEPGKVEFTLIEHHRGGNSNDGSDWPMSAFAGVDFAKAGRQDVRFSLTRDAGKFDCEGFLNDGEGAGIFHFTANPSYAAEMRELGFPIDDEKQYGMAVQDVSLEFARAMKNEHLSGLDADKLVAFRIHGVTPEMVRFLRQAGYSPDEDMLVAMRIHGATPEWMEKLKQRGYDHVDLEQLIAFRIHGVSPEFISKLQELGYSHPEPEQLVAMRIHDVTPEYISGLRSRGMEHLSIDQLVGMRIQGID